MTFPWGIAGRAPRRWLGSPRDAGPLVAPRHRVSGRFLQLAGTAAAQSAAHDDEVAARSSRHIRMRDGRVVEDVHGRGGG